MNKILFKNKLILAGMIALLFAACEDGDQVFDQIVEAEKRGAVARTIEVIENEIQYDVATNSIIGGGFGVIVEVQDQEDGDLLSALNVYVGYSDNTDSEGNSTIGDAETLVQTFTLADGTIGEFGLPRFTYTATASELQSAIGVTGPEIFGGDQFTVRFEIVQTDGSTYSAADNSGTLTGSFFSSPFEYTANIVCAPSAPTAGTWMVNTTDTFGDGWNGGQLNIVIDGGTPIVIANVDDGTRPFAESVQDFTFEVPVGSSTISIIYTSGAFDEEVLFTVTSANTNVVADEGTNPTTDVELLDFCPDNL